ncbi:hypothetical protein M0811_13096 [Anaeramoeba ignava]|uniref:HIT domain-containing protein n=1 Tax=Anaeramoeba ignava TaxID=1746090 RepID=A0A9Q0R5J2_ANAIG|nr:hypothetical protein M0811_13096 [Anaeramoeba ignava]
MQTKEFFFDKKKIPENLIIYETEYSICFICLNPIISGQVIVSSKRKIERFEKLDLTEATDIWICASKISKVLQKYLECSSFTFALNDGPYSNQLFKHSHLNIIPRKVDDKFSKNNDELYSQLEKFQPEIDIEEAVKFASIFKKVLNEI